MPVVLAACAVSARIAQPFVLKVSWSHRWTRTPAPTLCSPQIAETVAVCELEVPPNPSGEDIHLDEVNVRVGDQELVRQEGCATYPDAAVICDARERSPVDSNAITTPRVLVEVTSPSTEAYDRGEKAEHYRRIESLQAYIILAHDRKSIEVYERRDDGWRLVEARAGKRVAIESIGISLAVADVYQDPLGGNLERPVPRRTPGHPVAPRGSGLLARRWP